MFIYVHTLTVRMNTHSGRVLTQRNQHTQDRVCLLLPVTVWFSVAGVHEPVLQRHDLHPHGRCGVRPRTVLRRLSGTWLHSGPDLNDFPFSVWLYLCSVFKAT